MNLLNRKGILDFNLQIKTQNSFILARILKPAELKTRTTKQERAMPSKISKSGRTPSKTYHTVLCHTKDQNTRATARRLVINTSWTARNCLDCAISKAKQKAIKKGGTKDQEPVKETTKYYPCEKLRYDISNSKAES